MGSDSSLSRNHAIANFYSVLFSQPREARQQLLHSMDDCEATDLLATDPLLIQMMIDYFRLTLDYHYMMDSGLKSVIYALRHWSGNFDSHQIDALIWCNRFLLHLERIGRLTEMSEKLNLNSAEIAQYRETAAKLSKESAGPPPWSDILIQKSIDALPDEDGFRKAVKWGNVSIQDDCLNFWPIGPDDGGQFRFRLAFRGSRFAFQSRKTDLYIQLIEGSAQSINIYGVDYLLEDELTIDFI